MKRNDRALGLLIGVIADRIIPDPPSVIHPVALFGTYVAKLEEVFYQDQRHAGIAFWAAAVVPPVVATTVIAKKAPTATLAVALWASLGGSTLEKIGGQMADHLEQNDVAAARGLVPWLCSRDPELLDKAGIARATVESLAENTSDAAISSLIWAGIGGAPAVVAHRCINTLDAMVGYRNPRYENFGWASARIDDGAAFVPARVTALIHCALAARYGRSKEAFRAWKEDALEHPSTNAGPVEATAAAALGVQLGGETQYKHGTEMRPQMGRGPAPTEETIRDAIRLSRNTQILSAAIGIALAWGMRRPKAEP